MTSLDMWLGLRCHAYNGTITEKEYLSHVCNMAVIKHVKNQCLCSSSSSSSEKEPLRAWSSQIVKENAAQASLYRVKSREKGKRTGYHVVFGRISKTKTGLVVSSIRTSIISTRLFGHSSLRRFSGEDETGKTALLLTRKNRKTRQEGKMLLTRAPHLSRMYKASSPLLLSSSLSAPPRRWIRA